MSTSQHDHGRMDPPRVQEVADGAFAYIQPDGTWWINNTGFLVGPEGVVAIDGCATEARTRMFQETIAKHTDAPVRTLINTHHHGDHTNGNYLFESATIVAHENTRPRSSTSGIMEVEAIWPGVGWGALRAVPPFLTFTDSVTVYAGELRAQVKHFGPAHTSNDSVVWLEEQGVLYTGDLIFNGGTPFLLMGSPAATSKCWSGSRRWAPPRWSPGTVRCAVPSRSTTRSGTPTSCWRPPARVWRPAWTR